MQVQLATPLKTPTGNIITEAGLYDVISTEVLEHGSKAGKTSFRVLGRGHYSGSTTIQVCFVPRRIDKVIGA